jgi:hypothetical protein
MNQLPLFRTMPKSDSTMTSLEIATAQGEPSDGRLCRVRRNRKRWNVSERRSLQLRSARDDSRSDAERPLRSLFPLETAEKPMFMLLRTPNGHKKWLVYDGGHFVPREQLIRETLIWFDRYLGNPK